MGSGQGGDSVCRIDSEAGLIQYRYRPVHDQDARPDVVPEKEG